MSMASDLVLIHLNQWAVGIDYFCKTFCSLLYWNINNIEIKVKSYLNW